MPAGFVPAGILMLAHKIGEFFLFRFKRRNLSFAGGQHFEQPGHVFSEYPHDLGAFFILRTFARFEAMGDIPVVRGRHEHFRIQEIVV